MPEKRAPHHDGTVPTFYCWKRALRVGEIHGLSPRVHVHSSNKMKIRSFHIPPLLDSPLPCNDSNDFDSGVKMSGMGTNDENRDDTNITGILRACDTREGCLRLFIDTEYRQTAQCQAAIGQGNRVIYCTCSPPNPKSSSPSKIFKPVPTQQPLPTSTPSPSLNPLLPTLCPSLPSPHPTLSLFPNPTFFKSSSPTTQHQVLNHPSHPKVLKPHRSLDSTLCQCLCSPPKHSVLPSPFLLQVYTSPPTTKPQPLVLNLPPNHKSEHSSPKC